MILVKQCGMDSGFLLIVIVLVLSVAWLCLLLACWIMKCYDASGRQLRTRTRTIRVKFAPMSRTLAASKLTVVYGRTSPLC